MSWTNRYMRLVQFLLPSPFALAILLTFCIAVLALIWTPPSGSTNHIVELLLLWESGVWGLLGFTMQMMLILVLGHSLALSKPVLRFIQWITSGVGSNTSAAFLVTLLSLLTGYFNWGLGLIFGAILARRVGEHAQEKGIRINYPLIGASAYTALMVWHGGFSGSAPLTVAREGHSLFAQTGIIPINQTLFSVMNLKTFAAILLAVPLLALVLARKGNYKRVPLTRRIWKSDEPLVEKGAERLDRNMWFGRIFGILILAAAFLRFLALSDRISYLNLDSVNLILFGMALSFHGSLHRFVRSVEEAIRDAAGILIQFPLYAGLMGLMTGSGLLELFTHYIISMSDREIFPLFAFLSSAAVNIVIPSGGGQWQVQGPILVQAAQELQYPLSRTVMALAYGDQITNMIQPFWALPLLAITGLKARQILPYSFLFMLLGGIIYVVALSFW